ncbi:F-box domain-containing protein [Artemisia annua]|uniref:F-box domain-containing protein n=1 Tax=Artemisia annua TaxID=35608 RepID=A0A2U1PV85_ARTAN|nr:F-box domain-containing protein [Artemisia annua]
MSDNIPLDVQLDIMNRLPVKTILLISSVSKIWKANIDSQTFITSYGARPIDECLFNLTFDQGYKGFMTSVPENFTITPFDSQLYLAAMIPVGNSSGLTCFMYGTNMMAIVWNPSIRKSVGIFIPFYTHQIESSKICFGFGVRPDILDPTIVKVSYPVFQTGFWYVSVFSLNTLTWSRLQDFQLSRTSLRLKRKSQAVVGRFIYWAGTEKDTFSFESGNANSFSVCELGNSIVISGMIMTSEVPLFVGWLLDVDGSSITRFSNLFCIPTPLVNKLLGYTSNQAPIVEANVGHILGHSIFVFDPQAEKFVSLGIVACDESVDAVY